MKILYVTVAEWADILEAVGRWRGNWGSFQKPDMATHKAIEEVLGPDVAKQCEGEVRVEILMRMPAGSSGNRVYARDDSEWAKRNF